MPERSEDGIERRASTLDRLSCQWFSAFADFHLPGNAATEEYRAGRVVRIDDVEQDPAELHEPTQEIPLARDLTTCVLDFVRNRVTRWLNG